jgi:hypothetical protein
MDKGSWAMREGYSVEPTERALYLYKTITIQDDDEALAFALRSQSTPSAIREFLTDCIRDAHRLMNRAFLLNVSAERRIGENLNLQKRLAKRLRVAFGPREGTQSRYSSQ